MPRFISIAVLFTLICGFASAQDSDNQRPRANRSPREAYAPRGETMALTIDGLERTALVFLPSKASDATAKKADSGAPVVFAFHGHHGHSQQTARKFQIQRHWPEAIVVYMQGLPTAGLTDPEGKAPGWQKAPGEYEDRDLKFFDALLAKLKAEHAVDAKRIFAMGHSNGGMFTYTLWAARGEQLAAVAPVAATGARLRDQLTAKPAMHFAGRKDPLVPFALQQRSIDVIKKLNSSDSKSESWTENCRYFASDNGTPFVEYIHPGGHEYPDDASELIVKFFKQQSLK